MNAYLADAIVVDSGIRQKCRYSNSPLHGNNDDGIVSVTIPITSRHMLPGSDDATSSRRYFVAHLELAYALPNATTSSSRSKRVCV